MPSQRSFIKDHKQRGEWAELRFMARAAEHGLSVSKPWGDSQRYDVTVEHNGRFLRVQVKSTVAKFCDRYVCSIRSSRGQHYTRREVDFFAIYVVLEDAWYIMPAAVVVPLKGHFMLAPRRKGQKYERYLEAWDLLRGKDRDKEKDKYKDTTIPQPTSAAVEHPQTEPSNLFNSDGVVHNRLQRSMETVFSRLRSRS